MYLLRTARRWLRQRKARWRPPEEYGADFSAFAARHFDPEFYLARNPDVARSGQDPISHWIDHGLREERVFSPDVTVKLVPPEIQRDPKLTYLSYGTDLLQVQNGRKIPAAVLSQLMEQAQHDPIILGPGALVLPNLPVQTTGEIAVDLDVVAQLIEVRPRAVFVIPLLVIGGAEKYAADICRVLQQREVGPIAVIVTDQDQQTTGDWKDLPIIEPFQSTNVLFWRDVCGEHSDPQMLASLLAYLEPKLIIVTYSGICLQAITRYGNRLAQKSKIFCTFFGLGQDGLGAPYGITFARFTSSFAISITDNKRAASVLDRRFDALGRPAAVIPPRAPIVPREMFERRLTARSARVGQGEAYRWVWVSRLDKAKGLDVVRALAELRPKDSFDLYGPSHLAPDQLGLDLPNIRLCGILKDVSLADFSEYDGFLFTSPLEGMPNIVLEISQHAIPMIISNAGGLPETFDADSAIIVAREKTVALTADGYHAACSRLISMTSASKIEMIEKAYLLVQERHSAEAFEARVCDVLGIET